MKTEAEALRQELARTAEEHISTFPSRPMVYPEERSSASSSTFASRLDVGSLRCRVVRS